MEDPSQGNAPSEPSDEGEKKAPKAGLIAGITAAIVVIAAAAVVIVAVSKKKKVAK